jgi:hypothetical protein
MEFIFVSTGFLFFIGIIFLLTHLRPLNTEEIEHLGNKRRGRQIRNYFSFNNLTSEINDEFKKKMNPNGALYHSEDISLFDFPSKASALLKYKKHEWIIIAFEKHEIIKLLWLNKGSDRSGVYANLSKEMIVDIAKKDNYISVLIFHNHPNSNPQYYDCSSPSNQDLESADEYAQLFNKQGINLIEFICERGRHYEYYISPSSIFLPLVGFVTDIEKSNAVSKLKNLALHVDRVFKHRKVITY